MRMYVLKCRAHLLFNCLHIKIFQASLYISNYIYIYINIINIKTRIKVIFSFIYTIVQSSPYNHLYRLKQNIENYTYYMI